MEKKCKKAKWLSEEALQIAVKRREAKGKGEKERYTHLNSEFQRIARRDNQLSQIKELSACLCMGRCKRLGSLQSFLSQARTFIPGRLESLRAVASCLPIWRDTFILRDKSLYLKANKNSNSPSTVLPHSFEMH